MTTYLLSDAGDLICAEGGDRLVWETSFLGKATSNSAVTVAVVGRRVGMGLATVASIVSVGTAARRVAVGATSITGAGAVVMDAAGILLFDAWLVANSIMGAFARLRWTFGDPVSTVWNEQAADEHIWNEKAPGVSSWSKV